MIQCCDFIVGLRNRRHDLYWKMQKKNIYTIRFETERENSFCQVIFVSLYGKLFRLAFRHCQQDLKLLLRVVRNRIQNKLHWTLFQKARPHLMCIFFLQPRTSKIEKRDGTQLSMLKLSSFLMSPRKENLTRIDRNYERKILCDILVMRSNYFCEVVLSYF